MTAQFTEFPPGWTRDDWLAHRKLGLGGSDVAAICGLSTFGSPVSVYFDKIGLAPEQPENEAMQWGRLLEAPIAAEFTERTDLHVVVPQVLVVDDEHPWRRATLDGLVVESLAEWEADAVPPRDYVLGTIQIKTTRDGVFGDEIPDRIALQCQWEMGIATLDRCWLAVLHGGQRLEVYEIEFNELVYSRLCTIADRFWETHVLAENPPPTDSNPATSAALKAAFTDSADGSWIEFSQPIRDLAVEWLVAKETQRASDAFVELIENRLRSELGEAIVGTDDQCVELVTWKPQRKARRVDEKKLRADHPDIWEQYASPEGVTRVLRATKALKALVEPVDAEIVNA